MRTNPKTSRRRSSWLSRRGFSMQSFSGSQPDRRRLVFEPLEDRRLLAVFTVSNLNDAGGGSLRDAITMANVDSIADTIDFSVTGQIDIASQLPTITESVTITGPRANLLSIDAGNGTDNVFNTGDGYRIFNIDGGTATEIDVELRGLTLSGGDVGGSFPDDSGGAILNSENLTLTSSTLSGNSADRGGGIFNGGTVTITSSTLSGNSAYYYLGGGGGGIFNGGTATISSSTLSGNSAGRYGGGISNYGTATISNSTLSGNSARGSAPFLDYGSGGGIHNTGTVTISSSTLSGNSAYFGGGSGGIANGGTATITSSTISGNFGSGISNGGTATITSSTISGNSFRGIFNGGTATISSSTISGNTADRGGAILNSENLTLTSSTLSGNSADRGGGIFNTNTGTATLTSSTLSGNSADRGGGIFNGGTVTITSSTLSGNSAYYYLGGGGGGIFNGGTATISSSTLSGNSAGRYGGGISNYGTATISNSTLSGNSARGSAPFLDYGSGGGIHNTGTVTISSSTLSGNSAYLGGGIYNSIGTATITSSLVAGNTAASSGGEIWNNSMVNLDAYNLIGEVSQSTADALEGVSTGATDITATNVGTTPTALTSILDTTLADNGGPTLTHALVAGSPAIDAGDPAAMAGVSDVPEFDQRGAGFGRVNNGHIDIGAYEVTPSADFDSSGIIDGFDFLLWQIGFGTPTPTATPLDGDADFDLDSDGNDLSIWESQFGQAVPIIAPLVATAESMEPITVALALEPVEVAASAPRAASSPTAAELADAALATVWLGKSIDEEATFVAEEAALDLALSAGGGTVERAVTTDAVEIETPRKDSDRANTADDPWLSDELLERMFG